MQLPPMPDGSLPGAKPYVPTAPLPPGQGLPAPTASTDLSGAAFASSLALFLGGPVVMVLGWGLGGDRAETVEIMTWMLVGVGGLCVAAFVLSLVAIARVKRGQTGRTTLSVAALVLSILAPFPTFAAWLFSVLLLAGGGAHGRPLRRRGGGAAVTPHRSGAGWGADVAPHVDDLDAATRSALARAWAEDAALEHASIAAFGRLALDLVALGAPPHLVAGAHRAALEEIEHARVAYAFASAYAGAPIEAGPLPEAGVAAAESRADRIARIVHESTVDGMVGEAAAARTAAQVAARTVDPVVRAALARVAAEEATHAELAHAVVAWCMETDVNAALRGRSRATATLRTSLVAPVVAVDEAWPGRPSSFEVELTRRVEARRVLGELAEPRLDVAV